MTLAGNELAWGPGAEPPEVHGFWAINNCQMSMLLYLSCDTGRSRICVGSRGEAPGSSGVLGNKLLSDEHAFIYLKTLAGHELARGPGAEPPEFRGFGQ